MKTPETRVANETAHGTSTPEDVSLDLRVPFAEQTPTGDKRFELQVRRLRESITLLKESLADQIYYAIGLGLRKGLPILFIPVIVHYYGESTYAGYVLFYSSIQIFTVLCCLAVPESAIVFWYRESSKPTLLVTYLVLLCVGLFTVGSLSSIGLYYVCASSLKGFSAGALTVLGLGYVALNGTNTFLLGVYRAMGDSKKFLSAQLVAGLAWMCAMVLLARTGGLSTLVLAFLLSLLIQDAYLLVGLRASLREARLQHFRWGLAVEVLSFSAPLVMYVAATLASFWIDKYLVSLFFSGAIFSQFAITFQYAFGQSFLSQFFSLYSFPVICQKVVANDHAGLKSVLWTYNALMSLFGVIYVGTVLIVHQYFFSLRINVSGFLIMGSAFLLSNICSNYVNVLYAHKRSGLLTGIQISGACLMVALLIIGCRTDMIRLCYFSELAMWGLMLAVYLYVTNLACGKSRLVTANPLAW